MARTVAEFEFVRRAVRRPFLALHRVEPNPGGWFDVTSGRSGNVYRVRPTGGMTATCECEGYERSPAPCSHVRAVWEFADALADEGLVQRRTVR